MSQHLRMTPDDYAAHQARVRRNPETPSAELARKGLDKPRKYRNVPTVVDGITFDSKKEANQWRKLLLRQGSDQIRGLQRQVPYPLEVNGILVATYVADMTFFEGDKLIVLDVKGYRTAEYRLKNRLMAAIYGIKIKEV